MGRLKQFFSFLTSSNALPLGADIAGKFMKDKKVDRELKRIEKDLEAKTARYVTEANKALVAEIVALKTVVRVLFISVIVLLLTTGFLVVNALLV